MPKERVPHLVNESYNQVAIVTDYSCHVSFSPGSDFSPYLWFSSRKGYLVSHFAQVRQENLHGPIVSITFI